MNWSTISAYCFLLESDSPLNWSNHKSLHTLSKRWRFDISDAGLRLSAVKLNQIFHTVNIFHMKKAHTSDQKDHTKKPLVCHFCIALKGCDFWLLTPSTFFAYPEYRFEGWLLSYHGIFCLKYCFLLCNLNLLSVTLGWWKNCKT